MTQSGFLLNFIEKICRSNLYLFIFSRFIIGKFLPKIVYDNDFKILKNLKKKNFFNNKKVILDIGGNDGMSYYIIRKFVKGTKIVSFEPNLYNFLKLKEIKKKDKLYNVYNFALSNKNSQTKLIIPFFNNYALTQIAGLDIKGVKKRLKIALFEKNLFKKIYFKKTPIISKKLDNFKFKPSFIKIDIEGHEYECILGGLKTIKKFKPILMVEYDKVVCAKIYKVLKKLKYKQFFYNKKTNKMEKYRNENILNIFFVHSK